MTPSGEIRVEPGIFQKTAKGRGYRVRVMVAGVQHSERADTLDTARAIREQLRRAQGAPTAYPAYRLTSTRTPEATPVSTDQTDLDREEEGDESELEIPENLRPAWEALNTQRDDLETSAAPLREQLRNLEQALARVQGAIDALEGREPDASAELRAPGALKDRLAPAVREGFRAPRRAMITREQSAQLRDAVLAALPIGVDRAIGREELTRRVTDHGGLEWRTHRDQVSRAAQQLRDDGLADRTDPQNPKDIAWYRTEGKDNSDGGGE